MRITKWTAAMLLALLAPGASRCSADVLSYSFTASNQTDATVPFAADFFLPITAIASPFTVTATLNVTLTDADGDGVSLTATGQPFVQDSLINGSTDAGVGLGTVFSGGPGPAGSVYVLGPFVTGPLNGPAGTTVTELDIKLSFRLSGHGDSAKLTGTFTVTPGAVPEPSSLALCGLGAVGLVGYARRRRAARG